MTGSYSNRVSLFGALNHESNVGIAESDPEKARFVALQMVHAERRSVAIGAVFAVAWEGGGAGKQLAAQQR